MEPKESISPFWRGYGSCLTLRSSLHKRALKFSFRGRDLLTLTTNEAIGEDWRMVGISLSSALIAHQSAQHQEEEEADQIVRR
jgi:hypothetical protein